MTLISQSPPMRKLMLNRNPINLISILSLLFFIGIGFVQAQPELGPDQLGISFSNPQFTYEFNGSFEVGLRPGAPAMDERESVILQVVSDMYIEDIDAALQFVFDEIRREEERIRSDRRYRQGNEFDYVYSANIEYAIGQLYQLKRDRRRAEDYYFQAIEKYPSYVDAYIRLMELYLNEEDCEQALAAGRKAIEIGGVDGFVFKGFGMCHIQETDYDAALTAFRMAGTFLPDDESVQYYYALAAFNAGYSVEAVSILEQLVTDFPQNSNYHFLLVNAYLQEGDYQAAIEIIEIAHRKGMGNSASYSLLGDIYISDSMPESAADAYASSLTVGELPAFETARKQFDNLHRLNVSDATERYFDQLVIAYEGRLRQVESREFNVLRARVLIDNEQTPEAVSLLQAVIEEDPLNGEALLSLARYYNLQSDYERASVFFEQAANDDDVALTALTENAQLAIDRQNWDGAFELLLQASQIATPDSATIIASNLQAIARILELLEQ